MIEQQFQRQPEAYTLEFDRRPNLSPVFINRQLETHIGERFNVLLSTTRYEVKGGAFFAEESSEPFLGALARGRDYRRLYGNSIDRERENAEVIGFQKTERELVNPETPPGTMILSFSRKGKKDSAYQHNFYDIFIKKEDERGSYIEARRYSSALDDQDCARFYLEMGFEGKGEVADDVFFLLNPIKIKDERFKTADSLHEYLHKEHKYASVKELGRILQESVPLRLAYINAVATGNKKLQELAYNALLNGVDQASYGQNIFKSSDIKQEVYRLGLMPVRQVMTGCGSSGGVSIEKSLFSSPFSVSEFSTETDDYGSLTFRCPHEECRLINKRLKNKLISNCQHCGKDVRC